jgi:hypothetical protein
MIEFDCIASLDKHIRSIPADSVTTGVVGRWKGIGEEIKITGKKKCGSSYFGNHFAVRWKSGSGTGLFGSGLACYLPGNKNDYPKLPIVK